LSRPYYSPAISSWSNFSLLVCPRILYFLGVVISLSHTRTIGSRPQDQCLLQELPVATLLWIREPRWRKSWTDNGSVLQDVKDNRCITVFSFTCRSLQLHTSYNFGLSAFIPLKSMHLTNVQHLAFKFKSNKRGLNLSGGLSPMPSNPTRKGFDWKDCTSVLNCRFS